jgi:hypothetical protein
MLLPAFAELPMNLLVPTSRAHLVLYSLVDRKSKQKRIFESNVDSWLFAIYQMNASEVFSSSYVSRRLSFP